MLLFLSSRSFGVFRCAPSSVKPSFTLSFSWFALSLSDLPKITRGGGLALAILMALNALSEETLPLLWYLHWLQCQNWWFYPFQLVKCFGKMLNIDTCGLRVKAAPLLVISLQVLGHQLGSPCLDPANIKDEGLNFQMWLPSEQGLGLKAPWCF